MIVFLIGAGVGLVAGAGLGFLIAALLANARVEAATTSEMQASRLAAEALTKAAEANERADGYLAELDALTESTRPAGDPSVLRSCSRCLVAADSARTCTVVGRLDGGCPECGACRDCISLAEQCAERDEVPEHCAERPDGDLSDVLSGRIRAENWAQQGLRAAAEMTELEAEAFRRRWRSTGTGPHRPGIAIYPRPTPREGK